jgi:hypothetical protein
VEENRYIFTFVVYICIAVGDIFTNLLTQDWHGAGFYVRVGAQFIDEESKIPVRYRAATVG